MKPSKFMAMITSMCMIFSNCTHNHTCIAGKNKHHKQSKKSNSKHKHKHNRKQNQLLQQRKTPHASASASNSLIPLSASPSNTLIPLSESFPNIFSRTNKNQSKIISAMPSNSNILFPVVSEDGSNPDIKKIPKENQQPLVIDEVKDSNILEESQKEEPITYVDEPSNEDLQKSSISILDSSEVFQKEELASDDCEILKKVSVVEDNMFDDKEIEESLVAESEVEGYHDKKIPKVESNPAITQNKGAMHKKPKKRELKCSVKKFINNKPKNEVITLKCLNRDVNEVQVPFAGEKIGKKNLRYQLLNALLTHGNPVFSDTKILFFESPYSKFSTGKCFKKGTTVYYGFTDKYLRSQKDVPVVADLHAHHKKTEEPNPILCPKKDCVNYLAEKGIDAEVMVEKVITRYNSVGNQGKSKDSREPYRVDYEKYKFNVRIQVQTNGKLGNSKESTQITILFNNPLLDELTAITKGGTDMTPIYNGGQNINNLLNEVNSHIHARKHTDLILDI